MIPAAFTELVRLRDRTRFLLGLLDSRFMDGAQE
jgi:hypothetical protein